MTAGNTSVAEAVAYLRARGEDEAVGTIDTRWAYKRSADYIESALVPQPVVDREAAAKALHTADLRHLWATEICSEACRRRYYAQADAILALLNGRQS